MFHETSFGMEPVCAFHETLKRIVRNLQERRTKLTRIRKLRVYCTKPIQVRNLEVYCTKPLGVLYEISKSILRNLFEYETYKYNVRNPWWVRNSTKICYKTWSDTKLSQISPSPTEPLRGSATPAEPCKYRVKPFFFECMAYAFSLFVFFVCQY